MSRPSSLLPSKFRPSPSEDWDSRPAQQKFSRFFSAFESSRDGPRDAASRTEAIKAFLCVGSPAKEITREVDSRFSFLEHPSAPRQLGNLRSSHSTPSESRHRRHGSPSPLSARPSVRSTRSADLPRTVTPPVENTRESRKVWPRVWEALATPARHGSKSSRKSKQRSVADDSEALLPLDGEEGVLIDDEGFFDSYIDRRRVDFLAMLPVELSLYLLLFLDLPSILSCLTVSRSWNVLANDDVVWRELFTRQPGWRVNLRAAQRQATANLKASELKAEDSELRSSFPIVPPIGRSFSNISFGSSSLSLGAMATPGRFPRASMQSSILSDFRSPSLAFDGIAPLSLGWKSLYRTHFALDARWRSAEPHVTRLFGHQDSVYCVQFDSERIVSGSRDHTIRVWDTKTGKLQKTLRGHEGSVLCLQYDAASSFMLSGSSDKCISVWDLDKGVLKGKMTGHLDGVLDLRFNDKWIVSCGKDGTVRIWHRSTLEPHLVLAGHDGPVNGVGLKGNSVVSASGDGKMNMWDVETGNLLRQFEGHNRGVACVALTGDYVISGSNDQLVKVYKADSGECLRTYAGHDHLVRALAADHRTGRVVSGSYDHSLRIWDLNGGEEAVRAFPHLHDQVIFDVAFDCSRIVTASFSNVITILDFGRDLDTSLFL